jgi:hypothetical protein
MHIARLDMGNIIDEIVKDIEDRRGLGDEWNAIDEEIQEEIKNKWLEIIKSNIYMQT